MQNALQDLRRPLPDLILSHARLPDKCLKHALLLLRAWHLRKPKQAAQDPFLHFLCGLVGKGYGKDLAVEVLRLGAEEDAKVLLDQGKGLAAARRSIVHLKNRS